MGALIWLASYPKSGNTWCRAFINNLLRNPDQPVSINELDFLTTGESSAFWYKGLINKPITEYSRPELAAMRAQAQLAITRATPDSVFVKTHNILGAWNSYPLHNMKATVAAIYIVRNPLDVAISMTSHYGMTIDQAIFRLSDEKAVTGVDDAHVPEVHGSWSNHVKSWTTEKHKQKLVLRYEDMLNKPFPTFSALTKFLGLKPPKQRIRKAIEFASFKELKKQEEKEDFKERSKKAESFFRSGKAGQWQEMLSEDQIARIIHDNYEQMNQFKYLPKDWEERIAAWQARVATGESESSEAWDERAIAEMEAKEADAEKGADRQAQSDRDGAIGALTQPGI